jgi:hypothetical protein
LAWGEVLVKLLAPGVNEICPLSLSITGFSEDGAPHETLSVRTKLEELLNAKGVKIDIETVALSTVRISFAKSANMLASHIPTFRASPEERE